MFREVFHGDVVNVIVQVFSAAAKSILHDSFDCEQLVLFGLVAVVAKKLQVVI